MPLRVGAATDTGRVRQLNEDAYASRAGQGLFVVCDGMGGAASGEVASRLAVECLVDHLNGAEQERASADSSRAAGYRPRTIRLGDAVRQANQRVYDRAQQNVLLRALGLGPEIEVDLDEVPLRAGDYLMLCSDGLTRMVAEPELAGAISRHRATT